MCSKLLSDLLKQLSSSLSPLQEKGVKSLRVGAVEAAVSAWLSKNRWEVIERDEEMRAVAQFTVKKGPVYLAIKCSGSDFNFLSVNLTDLRFEASRRGFHPVCIIGDRVDPLGMSIAARQGSEIALHVSRLCELNSEIDALNPTLTGTIDWIALPKTLRGWAKLSPRGRATLIAFHKGEVVGRCVADRLRRDLVKLGDGLYGFELTLSKEFDEDEIRSDVTVKAYLDNVPIGILSYWKEVLVTVGDERPFWTGA
jgi:hypothetical protein